MFRSHLPVLSRPLLTEISDNVFLDNFIIILENTVLDADESTADTTLTVQAGGASVLAGDLISRHNLLICKGSLSVTTTSGALTTTAVQSTTGSVTIKQRLMQSAAGMTSSDTVQGATTVSLTTQGGALDIDDDITSSAGTLTITGCKPAV